MRGAYYFEHFLGFLFGECCFPPIIRSSITILSPLNHHQMTCPYKLGQWSWRSFSRTVLCAFLHLHIIIYKTSKAWTYSFSYAQWPDNFDLNHSYGCLNINCFKLSTFKFRYNLVFLCQKFSVFSTLLSSSLRALDLLYNQFQCLYCYNFHLYRQRTVCRLLLSGFEHPRTLLTWVTLITLCTSCNKRLFEILFLIS